MPLSQAQRKIILQRHQKTYERIELDLARNHYGDWVAIGNDGLIAAEKTEKKLRETVKGHPEEETLLIQEVTTWPELQMGPRRNPSYTSSGGGKSR